MGTVSKMKISFALLLALPFLASSLKIQPMGRETYASYAKRNGLALEKSNEQYQYVSCYDYFGQQGQSYRITDYVPDLRSSGWDNKFSSCCFYGTWVMYADSEYNERNPSAQAYSAWGENYCEDLRGSPSFDNQASSVRFVGAPDGYKYDTINLYEWDFYMGLEQYAYGDAPTLNYDNLGRSAIVTGCTPWTLYEYNNYQGRCACVYPTDQSNCYPGFYKSLGNVANQISSARKGCYCNKKLAPAATMYPKTKSGTVGQSESNL